MKTILDRQALQIALAADVYQSGRPALECVKIGNGEIMACDGFVFAKRQIKTDPSEGEEILVNAQDIKEAARIISGDVTLESNGTVALLKNKDATVCITAKLQDGKYPHPPELPSITRKAYVALQKHILSQVLEITKADDDIALQFKIREPHHPIEVISHETTLYVMPIYRPENEGE
jgi:hypothetical protein